MTELCRMCEEGATLFYVWVNSSDDHVRSYCKKCWSRRAKVNKRSVKNYTEFMDSGSTKVFYSLEEVQLYQIKKQL
jgi:hypothetical protein